tara:strand:+ start:25936 stop:26325 length:390 start_codon:yes stop_codon:yes gene_type:complete
MKKHIPLILKLVAAIIMLQTLFFKFTSAQESIDLFTKIVGENEAYMRIGTGLIELIASILLFIPKRTWLGAILATGTMFGAVISHFTILGIEHNNDSGALFTSAIIVFVIGLILLIKNKKDIPFIGEKL